MIFNNLNRKWRSSLLAACLAISTQTTEAQDLTTKYERTGARETVTYAECIAYWKMLVRRFPQLHIREIGTTDAGFPLHLVTLSPTVTSTMPACTAKTAVLSS